MSERDFNYASALIKRQSQSGGEIKIRYSLRVKGGMYLVVEDRRKIVEQNDGSKSLLCSLRNVTQKYSDPISTIDID